MKDATLAVLDVEVVHKFFWCILDKCFVNYTVCGGSLLSLDHKKGILFYCCFFGVLDFHLLIGQVLF